MKKKQSNVSISIETLIIVAIACCVLFLNTFTTKKLNELENAGHDAIFVMDEISFVDEEEFAEQIMDYLPDTYKMIELYDEKLDLLLQIQFSEQYVSKDDIHSHPDIVEILTANEEGQTSLTIRGYDQSVYFKWVTNSRGERRLLMIYSVIAEVNGIWVFSFICYIVLILVFILLIRLHTKHYREKIKQYHSVTKTLRKELQDN